MANVLVAGGAGFIGSHLCEKLLVEGHVVYCVDNLSSGRKENIEHLLSNPSFKFFDYDITEEVIDRFSAVLTSLSCDLIINLASPASPVQYQKDPISTFKANVFGAYGLLNIAKNQKCRIVQASTSEIYGDPLVHPQNEEYFGNVNPIGPRACYDEGKRGAETLFADFRRFHGVNTGIFRIFNTYGPRMDPVDGRVISNFIVAALRGRDIQVHGDGSQTRSFCYVDDTVDAIYKFSFSDHPGPINLGNPGEFTINQLYSIISVLVGVSTAKVHVPALVDDPKQRKPDITKAKELLGWEPKVGLYEGLAKTIEHFKKVLNVGKA